MSSYKLTSEQERCVDLYRDEARFKIPAYAGTGKTSVLVEMAKAKPTKAFYGAFNAAIAQEAKSKFPRHVRCQTVHGFAKNAVQYSDNRWDADRLVAKVNAVYLQDALKIRGYRDISTCQADRGRSIRPRQWAFLIGETIRQFSRSDSSQFELWMVPKEGGLKMLKDEAFHVHAADCMREAEGAWERMSDPAGDLNLGHDGYLKLFQLQQLGLPGESIFVDEAQDLNPVMIQIMRNQSANIVVVGDQWQSIYGWRGAVNAMDAFDADHEARLTQTFRFGESLAAFATEILQLLGETVPLRGNPALTGSLDALLAPNVVLCRTNAKVMERTIEFLQSDLKPFIMGGVNEMRMLLWSVEKLMDNRPTEHTDLVGFNNWDEVCQHAEMPEGADLKPIVNLVNQHECKKVLDALRSLPKRKEDSDIIVSTAHRSKGLEWPDVQLESDMLRGVKVLGKDSNVKKEVDTVHDVDLDPELKLLYVACTRAERTLDIHPDVLEKLASVKRQRSLAHQEAAE